MIEELDDIVEEIANDLSIYGETRSVFTSSLAIRIREATKAPLSSGGVYARDRLAAGFMAAWLSNPEVFFDEGEDVEPEYYARMAKSAYIAADAFLAQSAPGVDVDKKKGKE